MKHPLRSFLSVLLALVLATLPMAASPLTALATGANYTQQYELALGLLSDLLNTDNLREAAKLFRELGSHSLSRYYAYYTDVIIRLQQDDTAAIGESLDTLGFLEVNKTFTADLAERGLPGCADLRQYGEARQLELAQRYTEAQAIYVQLSILDSIDRTVRLNPLAREEQRQAAEEAARQEAERQAAEEAARAEAEGKAAEEAARLEAERKAAEEAARKIAEEAASAEELWHIAVGNTTTFGHYEQDNDLSNGPEPIEWLVLDVQDDRALLLSRYGLDAKQYNETNENITWQNCSLRRWLKNEFINTAFTAQEQKDILTTAVNNSRSQSYWDTNGGNNTEDQIFLLSYAEANRYLSVTRNDRKNTRSRTSPTDYTRKQGIYGADDTAKAGWWLRSCGPNQQNAEIVSSDGSLDCCNVFYFQVCVRPALWINLADAMSVNATSESTVAQETPRQTTWTWRRLEAGSTLTFGHYEQDNDLSNGTEPIEWLVLDVQDHRALLLSRYGLDAKPYHEVYADITWENCSLRRWLNDEFINTAFTAREQTGILTTAVDNSRSQGYWDTDGGNNTQDQIFLLSYAEASKYLGVTLTDNNTKSRVAPTAYAVKRRAWTDNNYKTADNTDAGWWWLRSPGSDQVSASYVLADGSLGYYNVNCDIAVVRPALWINLESDIF